MNGYPKHILAVAFVSLGLLVAAPVRAATLTEVPRATWAGSVTLPSYLQMYVYAPDKVATNPPIVVSGHSCGSTASGQMGNITKVQAAADKLGFILVLPDNPNQNCWDVGSSQSLKHDGGGDTQGIAQMVKYALSKYSGDASRVYIFGGSSGGMLTQAMLAVYPDVFRAGSARAGVPAGCWADGYASSNQWSNTCAAGSVSKTAQQWGDLVRAMDPGYSGHRPRVQIIQGDADTTISYKNSAESIKEWTNVLNLSTTPTSTDSTTTSIATYARQFWKNACGYTVLEAWAGKGGSHSMGYEEDAILKFFGLDTATTSDPEPDCSGDGGVPGTGGVNGSGGGSGAGGGGGTKDGGLGGKDGGNDVAAPGSGGVQGSGGSLASGGVQGSGGSAKGGAGGGGGTVGNGGSSGSGGTSSAKGGASGSGGTSANGGNMGGGGSSAKGGSGGESSGGTQGNGGSSARGGNSGTGGSTAGGSTSSGCSIAVGSHAERSLSQLAVFLLAALGLIFRRQRRTRR